MGLGLERGGGVRGALPDPPRSCPREGREELVLLGSCPREEEEEIGARVPDDARGGGGRPELLREYSRLFLSSPPPLVLAPPPLLLSSPLLRRLSLRPPPPSSTRGFLNALGPVGGILEFVAVVAEEGDTDVRRGVRARGRGDVDLWRVGGESERLLCLCVSSTSILLLGSFAITSSCILLNSPLYLIAI